MTAPTILQDGRRVQADECGTLEFAFYGRKHSPDLKAHKPRREVYLYAPASYWYLECQCCDGSGEHHWSPSGHGVDPDGGHYGCGPCAGTGEFKVVTP